MAVIVQRRNLITCSVIRCFQLYIGRRFRRAAVTDVLICQQRAGGLLACRPAAVIFTQSASGVMKVCFKEQQQCTVHMQYGSTKALPVSCNISALPGVVLNGGGGHNDISVLWPVCSVSWQALMVLSLKQGINTCNAARKFPGTGRCRVKENCFSL